jgi:hypothetical protein
MNNNTKLSGKVIDINDNDILSGVKIKLTNKLTNIIYYTIGDTMLEVFFGVLAAVAVRDLYLELITRFQDYQYRKDIRTFKDFVEDIEADDDDIK